MELLYMRCGAAAKVDCNGLHLEYLRTKNVNGKRNVWGCFIFLKLFGAGEAGEM
jgi:hypothetical protein